MNTCRAQRTSFPSPSSPFSTLLLPLLPLVYFLPGVPGMGHPADFKDLESEFIYIPFGRSLTDGPPPDAAIILFIVTSLVTIYRCSTRYAKKLWGHDDSVALFSLFSFILFVIGSYNIFFRFDATAHGADDFDLRVYLSREWCAFASLKYH